MPYDDQLLTRIRTLSTDIDFVEKKMFGGVAFMLNGHMTIGILRDELMVRVGKDAYEQCLKASHVTEMKFTGRPMRGLIMVQADGIKTDKCLRQWIDKGLAFTSFLTPK